MGFKISKRIIEIGLSRGLSYSEIELNFNYLCTLANEVNFDNAVSRLPIDVWLM